MRSWSGLWKAERDEIYGHGVTLTVRWILWRFGGQMASEPSGRPVVTRTRFLAPLSSDSHKSGRAAAGLEAIFRRDGHRRIGTPLPKSPFCEDAETRRDGRFPHWHLQKISFRRSGDSSSATLWS